MKKSSLALIALLLTAPVFAGNTPAVVEQPLTLASADTSASVNLKATETNESATRLEKEAKAASDAVGAAIESKVAADVAKEVVTSVKF